MVGFQPTGDFHETYHRDLVCCCVCISFCSRKPQPQRLRQQKWFLCGPKPRNKPEPHQTRQLQPKRQRQPLHREKWEKTMNTKNKWVFAAFLASFFFPYFIRTGGGGTAGCGFNFILADSSSCFPSISFLLITWVFLLVVCLVINRSTVFGFMNKLIERPVKLKNISADIEIEKSRILASAIVSSAEIFNVKLK